MDGGCGMNLQQCSMSIKRRRGENEREKDIGGGRGEQEGEV